LLKAGDDGRMITSYSGLGGHPKPANEGQLKTGQ
jgi:hypothetical protein